MSTILPIDTSLKFPRVMVVDASAGAGKTTTLTQRLAQLLLSKKIPENRLSSLLAITFTNNAAVDMKQRVLSLLKNAALGEEKTLEDLRGLVSMNDHDLKVRAGQVLGEILDHYSEFQVQTIDSFLSRVFKASALEFGFTPGFNVVIDSRPLLDEAFDAFAGEIAEGTEAARLLQELAYKLLVMRQSDGKYLWNPYRELARQVKALYSKIVSTARPLAEEDRSKEYQAKGKKLCELIEGIGEMMDRSKLVPAARFVVYRHEARAGKIDRLLDLQFPDSPATKSKSPQIEFAKFMKSVESLRAEIAALRSELIVLHAQTYFEPYIETHRILSETLDRVKRRKGEVDLADITLRLARFMDDGTVPDLYVALGERIHHYMIDEFHDTAPIQWKTLVPLIENSLSEKGSLFVVGDTKQSIYGFRGADWRIMRDLRDGKFFPSAPTENLTLGMNYRSGERILNFTRTVFHDIVPFQILTGAAEASGLAGFEQEPRPEAKGKGYVESILMEGDTETRPEKETILKIVADCLHRGFALRDLAILTPENEDVVKVSGWLNEAGHPFVPFSTLDIRTRKVIGELIALLRFLDSPIDDLSFGSFLIGSLLSARLRTDHSKVTTEQLRKFIFDHHRENGRRPLYALLKEQYPDLWAAYFNHLFTLSGYLPLYDLTTQVYKRFGIFDLVDGEEAALVKLLEVVKHFEERGMNSLREFIGFAEEISEDSDWNIEVPPDVNAVRIMTVHKAKGLDFRVVIALLYDVALRADRVYMEETQKEVRLVRLVKKHGEENSYLRQLLVDRELNNRVDQLNKLYVALTRAKDEMYVLGVQYPQSKEPSSFLPVKGYEASEKPPVEAVKPTLERTAELLHHNLGTDQSNEAVRVHLEETKRGDVIHSVLARIVEPGEDLDNAVQGALRAEQEERGVQLDASIGESIIRFLRQPAIRGYFEGRNGRTILNEQEFVRNDGQLFRMDRVVVDRNVVTVIDYKTGDEQAEYAEQVRNYMAILKDVYNGMEVKGVLAYLDQNLVKPVL